MGSLFGAGAGGSAASGAATTGAANSAVQGAALDSGLQAATTPSAYSAPAVSTNSATASAPASAKKSGGFMADAKKYSPGRGPGSQSQDTSIDLGQGVAVDSAPKSYSELMNYLNGQR